MSTALTVLGLDYGTKKMGVAVGQTLTRTAMGIGVIPVKQRQPDWAQLDTLVQRWKPGAFVIGMPYNMDGSESPMSEAARQFALTVSARYDRHCHTIDERLSTREAREITRENNERIGKKHNDRAKVDAMVAQLLLESWFDQ
ncbi:MAG: Holliday junction resolvase RuvX, partial [Pseudohongiellaceae bacterium]